MKLGRKLFLVLQSLIVGLCFAPVPASACSVCFGDPESQIAKGASWSVIALLGIVMIVLTGFAAFFVFIARRAREMGPLSPPANAPEAFNQ